MSVNKITRGFVSRLLLTSIFVLGLFLCAYSYLVLNVFEAAFVPEVEKKSELVAGTIAENISQAIGYGIPLDQLTSMGKYLERFVQENDDIAAIQVIEPNGKILYSSLTLAQTATPIATFEIKEMVQIQIFARDAYLDDQLISMAFDLVTTILVSLLVAFELLSFFVHGRVLGPLSLVQKIFTLGGKGNFTQTVHCRATKELTRIENSLNKFLYSLSEQSRDVFDAAKEIRSAQISKTVITKIDGLVDGFNDNFKIGKPYKFKNIENDNIRMIRFPLFLFMFAEELSRPFLPLMAQQYQNVEWLGEQETLAAALPITVFMAIIVFVSLISGRWLEKWGGKKLFMLGIIPAFIGYIGVFFANDYSTFLVSRCVSAFGYAIVFVATQGYIASYSKEDNRASNMAIFIGGVLVAGICGPAIGGILASQIGYTLTFGVSAIFVLFSALVLLTFMGEDKLDKYQVKKEQHSRLSLAIFANSSFSFIAFLCAVPAKIILTSIIFLLTPLYLIELNLSEATIGRVLMIYGIIVIFIMPKLSKLSDAKGMHIQMVVLGGLLAGLGGMIFWVFEGLWASVVCVVLIGCGQAMSMPTQLAQVQHVFSQNSSNFSIANGLGVFRSVERLGSVIGPLLGGALAITYGIETAIAIIGFIGFVCVCLYGLFSLKKSKGN